LLSGGAGVHAVRRRVLAGPAAAKETESAARLCLRVSDLVDAVVDGLGLLQLRSDQAAGRRTQLSQPRQSSFARDLSLARQLARFCVSTRLLVAAYQGVRAGPDGTGPVMGVLFSARGFLSAASLVDSRRRGRVSLLDAVFYERIL